MKQGDTEIVPMLHDVAAILLQLEPTDVDDLERVWQTLQDVLAAHDRSSACPDAARKLVAMAAQMLREVIRGKAVESCATLEEASLLVAAAIEAHEDAADDDSQTIVPLTDAPETPPVEPPAAGMTEVPATASAETPPAALAETPPVSSPPVASAAYRLFPADADIELIGDFITECREYIVGAEAALLGLEVNPDDLEAINTVFRAFHTIKGTAAFLGLDLVSEFAHRAESLLSRVRDQEIRCTGGYADLALWSVDMLKAFLQAIQDALGGAQATVPDGLTDLMRYLADPEAAGYSEHAVAPEPLRVDDILVAQGKVSRTDIEEAATTPLRVGDILVAQGKVSREDIEDAVAMQGAEPLGVALMRSHSATASDVAHALRTQKRLTSGEQALESSVRVRTDRLDRLIDMVGELVIAHSMVAQDDMVLNPGHHELQKKITHAGKIVRELQDLSMSMRMVPFKATFQKMARVLRDVAHKSHKEITFTTEGEDTEIDRNMVDVISDPLVHMVRNAADHGIELPDDREHLGKTRTGTVRLAAYHTGGNVVVELQDDGRGLRRDKIVEKAKARGLIESEQGMSDSDVFNLIFEPGFSTAEHLTDISGRGVGMDVVRRSIESLHGRIEISSEVGKGTLFAVYLPLTLAITDGMLVRVGTERYIIPTIDIYMSFQPQAEALSTVIGRGELVMLRGELIPVLRPHRLFNVANAITDPTQGLLVVINDGERHCALLVDELLGQHQVVVKALGSGIGHVQGISGAAILGDGRVGLILDAVGLASLSRSTPAPGNNAGGMQRTAA
jgi:two-component system chemotaxis sensor kinase CheA